MKDHIFIYRNIGYTIRPVQSVDGVILFKVLQPARIPQMLELAILYAWVDKRLVELTARSKENSELLDAAHIKIKDHYVLK